MAIYDAPDALTLAVAAAQFPEKYATTPPTKTSKTAPFRVGLFFVCLSQVDHIRHQRMPRLPGTEDDGWWVVDGPEDLYHYMARDAAEMKCIVCNKFFSEVEESGCGYDPKKHR